MITDKPEEIIGVDFQGWPIRKKSLRDILLQLGFVEKKYKSGKVHMIAPNQSILDQYPVTLEDDGMGYGVNEKYICESQNNESVTYPIVFIIEPYDKTRADEFVNEMKSM